MTWFNPSVRRYVWVSCDLLEIILFLNVQGAKQETGVVSSPPHPTQPHPPFGRARWRVHTFTRFFLAKSTTLAQKSSPKRRSRFQFSGIEMKKTPTACTSMGKIDNPSQGAVSDACQKQPVILIQNVVHEPTNLLLDRFTSHNYLWWLDLTVQPVTFRFLVLPVDSKQPAECASLLQSDTTFWKRGCFENVSIFHGGCHPVIGHVLPGTNMAVSLHPKA